MAMQTVWIEIPVKDIERAAKFYGALFDVTYAISQDDVRRTATLTDTQQAGVGVSLTETKGFEPSTKGPLVYLDTGDDLTPMLPKVEPAGGRIVAPKTSMGPAGHYALFEDTEGNVLAFYSVH